MRFLTPSLNSWGGPFPRGTPGPVHLHRVCSFFETGRGPGSIGGRVGFPQGWGRLGDIEGWRRSTPTDKCGVAVDPDLLRFWPHPSMRNSKKVAAGGWWSVAAVCALSGLVTLVCILAQTLLHDLNAVTLREGRALPRVPSQTEESRHSFSKHGDGEDLQEKVWCRKEERKYRCRTEIKDLNGTCNLLHQTKLTSNTEPLVVGSTMRVITEEECCLACRRLSSKAGQENKCNSFSFCPSPNCWTYGEMAQYGECWLYRQEDPRRPEIELIGIFSSRFRSEYTDAPPATQWISGIVTSGSEFRKRR